MPTRQQAQQSAGRTAERPLFPTPITRQQVVTDRRGRPQIFEIQGLVGGQLDDTDVVAMYQGPADQKGRHRVPDKKLGDMEREALRAAGFTEAAALTPEEITRRAIDPAVKAEREAILNRALQERAEFQNLEPQQQRALQAAPLRERTLRSVVDGTMGAQSLYNMGFEDYGRPSTYLGLDRIYSTLLLNPTGDLKGILEGLQENIMSLRTRLTIEDSLRAMIQQVYPEFSSPAAKAAQGITTLLRNPLVATALSPWPFFDGLADVAETAGELVEGKRMRRILADGVITGIDLQPWLPTPFFNLGIAGNDLDTMDAVFSGGLLYLLEDALRNPQSPFANRREDLAQAILHTSPLETYFVEFLEATGVNGKARDRVNQMLDRMRTGINIFGRKLKVDFKPLQKGEKVPPQLAPYAERINVQAVEDEYNSYLLAHPNATVQSDSQLRVLHVKYRLAKLIEDALAIAQKRLPEPENI